MSESTERLKPFTKWTGGKRQLLPELLSLMPKNYDQYFEPFIGGGALFFDTMPKKATINDFNKDLVLAYRQIRDDVELLISYLEKHKMNNSKDYYLKIRSLDREEGFHRLSDVEKAARLIYMLRVDFNGLYRVNSKNQFNVPYGKYQNPKIVDIDLLTKINKYLNDADIKILQGDFELAVSEAKEGDFVYFDPPYAPVSPTSSFTSYTHEGFDIWDQKRLKDVFLKLTNRNVKVMMSNSDVELIHELYGQIDNVDIKIVGANRMINSRSSGRGKVNEVIIRNYR